MVLTFPVASWQQQNQAPIDNVVFGSHFDSFVDIKGHTITNAGTVTLDFFVKKFGTSSCDFPGNANGYLTISNPTDFSIAANQDFTIDCWYYCKALGDNAIFSTGDYGANGITFYNWSNGGYKLGIHIVTGFFYQWDWTPALNTWYYIGIKRQSNQVSAWVNGSQLGSSMDNSSAITANAARIGASSNTYRLNGKLDDFRFTKASRDLSIVPTSPFPDN